MSTPARAPLKRKVLIMGSRSVGKSSLTSLFMDNTFNEQYYPTIESTYNKSIEYDGVTYDCEIIDTAGQDEYSLFNHKYAVGIHGYILVYSIASRQSFDMIQTLHDKILDFQGVNKVCCVVVGQKSDLAGSRQVKKQEGEQVASKIGAKFIETSAKENQNVNQVFDLLLEEMRKIYNPNTEGASSGSKGSAGGKGSASSGGSGKSSGAGKKQASSGNTQTWGQWFGGLLGGGGSSNSTAPPSAKAASKK